MTAHDRAYSPTGGHTRPVATNRAETFWWKYMRWSGVLLIPLAFGHLLFVHLINSVAVIDHQWVIETRWAYLGWRIYDAFLLWFAGLHGYRGFRYVVDDYVHNKTLNRVLTVGMLLLMLAVLALGSIALIGTPFSLPE